jgi:YcxB-like protein
VLGFVALLTFGILVAYLLKPNAESEAALWPALPVIAIWLAILFFLPRWNAGRQFDKQPGAHGIKTVLFDDTGVHFRWDGGSSDLGWKHYVRWLEGKNQILLYPSPILFNVISKRGVSPERLAEIRLLLAEHISTK